MYKTRLAPSKSMLDSDGLYNLKRKPRRPVATTMCRMRGMSGGEAWRVSRWFSSAVKASGREGAAVQRMG